RTITESAAGAQTISSRLPKTEVSVDERVHDAVLEPQLMTLVPVPVDLCVDVVAVETLCSRVEVIGVVAGLIRLWNQRHHLHHRNVQPPLGDEVDTSAARKHGSARSISVATEGVENHALSERRGSTFCRGHEDRVSCRIENRVSEHVVEFAVS